MKIHALTHCLTLMRLCLGLAILVAIQPSIASSQEPAPSQESPAQQPPTQVTEDPAPGESIETLVQTGVPTQPFSWSAIFNWLLTHGVRVLVIFGVAILLLWFIDKVSGRLTSLIAKRPGPGTAAEREKRAKTLMAVFRSFAGVAVVTASILTALSEVGINIAPLLAGAGVVGLAVAFGAQNLIRDYFTGFLILLENQYGINDVVKLGDTAGLVENITLRVTRLRSLDGSVHFIPNGTIGVVTNMTHEYSRAVFDIGVAYKEEVDKVMGVLMELATAMRTDPKFGPLILDDPEMLGVDAFADSAVVIRFRIKTLPLQQWNVKRELLRRIKNRFDKDGIEIPFPHRTVFHRFEGEVPVDIIKQATERM